jgi:hypothetical protein
MHGQRITSIKAKTVGDQVEAVVTLSLRAEGGVSLYTPTEAAAIGNQFMAAAVEALRNTKETDAAPAAPNA